jgi:hypothetical protein
MSESNSGASPSSTEQPDDRSQAFHNVLVGGNHLADYLISAGCIPSNYRSEDEVRQHHGISLADIWVAWKAIMDARPYYGTSPMRESGEPTEAMCRRARGFIMGLDLGYRTWLEMHNHLTLGGYPTLPRIAKLAETDSKGHITKWDVAECIYMLMIGNVEEGQKP